jgi:hypothetical protein
MPAPSVIPMSALRTNPTNRLTRLPAAMIALWPAVPAPPSVSGPAGGISSGGNA